MTKRRPLPRERSVLQLLANVHPSGTVERAIADVTSVPAKALPAILAVLEHMGDIESRREAPEGDKYPKPEHLWPMYYRITPRGRARLDLK